MNNTEYKSKKIIDEKFLLILFEKLKQGKINKEHFKIFFEQKSNRHINFQLVNILFEQVLREGLGYKDFKKAILDDTKKRRKNKFMNYTYGADFTVSEEGF